ncbi:hypothetical protein B0T21DRAFT_412750 [Apiosordaria backusii]|uniref:Uncharacterized protein n=1 Tax=Apiosordaria backusii TaxID=314023 RepID=A0AA40BE84_9PEZI|nr:hypothetical protein B0T21DRAFT_412750 [Apiosordaria backusii]
MDVAYNQHSFRRKSRSSVNLNHLSLAPLTSKLPIHDVPDNDMITPTSAPPNVTSYSYLQGKSAPTTPRLLSRSPGPNNRSTSLSGSRTPSRSAASISKSKSSSHLPHNHNRNNHRQSSTSLHTSPTTPRRFSHHPNQLKQSDRSDSDWLLRCGSIISLETRESKGQAWLSTRASSTSLAGLSPQDAEDEAFERELAREREELVYGSRHTSRHPSRHASRRSSVHLVDGNDDNIYSPTYSRFGSRSHSCVGSMTPGGSSHRMTTFVEDYFNSNGSGSTPLAENPDEEIPGPDFVNLDEELENYNLDEAEYVNGNNGAEDEAYVRKLVKSGNGGVGSWFGHVLGVKLFAVEEDDEEESEDDYDGETTDGEGSGREMEKRASSLRRLEGQNMKTMVDESIPPPREDEGGWHDAAWLLTVASKVLL